MSKVTQGCLNDQLLGPVVNGCRGDFDFTQFFENLFLSIIPSFIFLVLSALRIANLVHRQRIPGSHPFVVAKQISIACYAILKLALVVLICTLHVKKGETAVAAAVLSFVEAFSFLSLSYYEHTRSWRPSIMLNSYLFLTLLFDAVRSRTILLVAGDATIGKVFSTALSLKVVILLFESQGRSKCNIPDGTKLSPEETSGPFSLSVFLWLNKLLLRGSRKVLGMNDLYPLDHTITSENLHPRIWLEWQKPGKKGRRGLLLALARSLGWSLFTPMPARLALSAFNFCQPLLINGVLSYLQSDTKSRKAGFGWMGATAIVYLGMSISQALYGYQRVRMQTMVRGFLVSAIFRKTTELKVTEVDNSASATLMSGDALHVEQVAYIVYDLSIIPIEFAVALALLQRQVGLGSLLQLLVVGLSFAASIGIGRASRNNRREMMKRIQLRVGSTANVISNMKSLKISGLAKEVTDVIQGLRDKELDSAWDFRAFIMAAAGVAWVPIYISPVLVFAVARKSLSTTRIFTAWSYLSLLNTPLTGFFQDLPRFIASMTSVDRIAAYLELDPAADYRKDISSESNTEKVTESGDIEKTPSCGKPASSWAIQSGYFGWKENENVLKDINISILTTGLTLVVGPVASGKSTLCKALLGEIPFAKGDVFFSRQRSRVGFCDQIVFLPNGSIRDIIVGFSDFDDAWYSTVLDATALVPDLNTFEDGDQTKVGTKGVALSGGQRQRLTIARALYARPDLLVFDDIFSGLDQKTEVAIFDRIFGAQGILKRMETPVLLCTHSIKHLAAADYIIALSADGTISEQGKYEDLLANEGYVFSLSRKSYIGGDNESGSESAQKPKDQNTASVSETSGGQRLEKSKRTKEATTKKADPVNDQSRQKGDFSVYSYYFSMAGYWLLVPFIAFPVIFGFFLSFSNVWLTYWSNYTTAHPVYGQTQSMYLGIFALIQVMTLTPLMIFGFFATLPIATRTGRNFHIKALNTLMAAPLIFFTTTDTGVTTNRFSQDMSMLDMNITFGLFIIAEICATIGQAIIIAITSPFIAISFPILCGMLYCVQQFYLKTSRQLRLLDLESKSPLFTHFLETLQGLATVRAFGTVPQHLSLNNHSLDQSQRPLYLLAMVQEWLGTTLGLLSAILAIVLVGVATQLDTSSGVVGAGLIAVMNFSNYIFHLVVNWTQLETSLGAISRLRDFNEGTKSENLPGEEIVPPPEWPEKGTVGIKGVTASYQIQDGEDRPLALRKIDIELKEGEKVAVCGRTGSGKSSLIMLLLRLLDPIESDAQGLSIDDLPLHLVNRTALRSRIIALPQDAFFLPEGNTVRANLDPYGLTSAAECEAAVRDVGLWSALATGKDGLDAKVDPQSLSQGQRQLFSLGRAILRARAKAKIAPSAGGLLLMDEVSSNVDIHTDKVMQEIIRREFRAYTIIAIAHRLETIMDFDRVLIMDAGEIVKSGPPLEVFKEIDVSRAFD